jgi:Holliday junction resolvase RusA-like endonuclease
MIFSVDVTDTLLEITVFGHAEPAGSKTSYVLKRKDGSHVTRPDGSIIVNTADANKKSKGWKQNVAQVVGAQWLAAGNQPLDGALALSITVFRPRPKGHFGSGKNEGKLKDWAVDEFPTTKPDVLKLSRGIEDALTGIVWRDDSQITDEILFKRFGEPERVVIRVGRPDAATASIDVSDEQRRPDENNDQLAL